jgi:hypothetical protein
MPIQGHAEVFQQALPRTLNVFEGIAAEDRTLELHFLDLDIYNDLDHIPLALKRTMKGSLQIMHGYCEVFGRIVACLSEGRAPNSSLLDCRIRYCWDGKSEDAKLFLLAGGTSAYALQYLLRTLKELMLGRNGSGLSDRGLAPLPACLNDIAYDLVGDRLLEHSPWWSGM